MSDDKTNFFRELSLALRFKPELSDESLLDVLSQVFERDSAFDKEALGVATVLRSSAASKVRTIGTSFCRVRDFALEQLRTGEIAVLRGCIGGPMEDEFLKRVECARDVPALAEHYHATAADHYAADVMATLCRLLGLPDDSSEIAFPSDIATDTMSGKPYLCFLTDGSSHA